MQNVNSRHNLWFQVLYLCVPIGQYFLNNYAKQLKALNSLPLFPRLRGFLRVKVGQLVGHPLHLVIAEVRDQNALQIGCVHELGRFSMMKSANHT